MDERCGRSTSDSCRRSTTLTQEMLRQQDVDAVLVFQGQSMDTEKADRLTRDSEVVTLHCPHGRPTGSPPMGSLICGAHEQQPCPRVTMSRIVEGGGHRRHRSPAWDAGVRTRSYSKGVQGDGIAGRQGRQGRAGTPREPINLDDSELNADWIKTRRWDLPADPEFYRGPTSCNAWPTSPPVPRCLSRVRATLEQGGTPR